MAVLKPKKRVIVFRISEDDYRQIQQVCDRTGARSLSEFARSVVLESANAGTKAPNGSTLTALAKRIGMLERKVELLGRGREEQYG